MEAGVACGHSASGRQTVAYAPASPLTYNPNTKTDSAYLGRPRAGPHFCQAVFVGKSVKVYKSYVQQVQLLADRGMDKQALVTTHCFRCSCDMTAAMKYRDTVREIAFDQYGYVATRDAVEAGVPAGEPPKLAARGALENIAYGLYRVPDVPPTCFDQFAEALLRVGKGHISMVGLCWHCLVLAM